MALLDALKDLIQELDRVHPGGQVDVPKLDRNVLPTFATAQTGQERHFTLAAQRALVVIVDTLYNATAGLLQRVGEQEYSVIVRQATADCHASGQFDLTQHGIDTCKASLKDRVAAAVNNVQTKFTHYFPAWTLGVESSQRFSVGPVRFLTRDQWIESVMIPAPAIRALSPRKGRAFDWKKRLRALLDGKARKSKNIDAAEWVFRAIKDCPSVLKVTVVGCEQELSRQLARFACKTALDSVALMFGNDEGEHHRQFVLSDERLIPIGASTLIETGGRLWLPGSKFRPRGWMGQPSDAAQIAKSPGAKKLLPACGKVIKTLLDPSTSSQPRLSQRWAMALSIYAEGCREVQDSLALAKLGSSLDILSGGRKEKGILDMLVHQTGLPATHVIVKLPLPQTLKQVVERVYKHGRSQVLHGTHIDPMMRFTTERHHATYLARGALRECVWRLAFYTGADGDTAFQTM